MFDRAAWRKRIAPVVALGVVEILAQGIMTGNASAFAPSEETLRVPASTASHARLIVNSAPSTAGDASAARASAKPLPQLPSRLRGQGAVGQAGSPQPSRTSVRPQASFSMYGVLAATMVLATAPDDDRATVTPEQTQEATPAPTTAHSPASLVPSGPAVTPAPDLSSGDDTPGGLGWWAWALVAAGTGYLLLGLRAQATR